MRRGVAMVLCVAAMAVSAVLSGCRSPRVPETVSHLLLADAGLTALPEASGGAVQVSLRPVELPEYLEGRRMVRVLDGDRVETVAGHGWAESFGPAVRAALEGNLARLLGVPCLGGDERLTLSFRRLSLTDRGTVGVSALCRSSRPGRSPRLVEFEVPVAEASRPSSAYSAALSRLSRELAVWLLSTRP
ncbi:MAG: membrane integrity-associated transporter subunit PqiC [Oligosphaeraceae bacterium]